MRPISVEFFFPKKFKVPSENKNIVDLARVFFGMELVAYFIKFIKVISKKISSGCTNVQGTQ